MERNEKVETFHKGLKLAAYLKTDFLLVVTNFVEKASLAFGLGKSEIFRLTLAAEEIFTYLCKVTQIEELIEISCTGGIYYTAVEFPINKRDFNLRALNITTKIIPESEESLEEMGLLIAARSVDRLQIAETEGEKIVLSLIKDKEYQSDTGIRLPEIPYMDSFSIKTPSIEEIKIFIDLLNFYCKEYLLPPSFKFPGKVVDMVSSTEYAISIAMDRKGLIGGGIIWRRLGEKTVECLGPYLFNQGSHIRMAEALLISCLEKIAKTEAVGLFCKYTTSHLPEGYFESLGTLTYIREDGTVIELSSFYRQLFEDTGCYVRATQELKPFLEQEYKRLVLPRQIHSTQYQGETVSPHSVLIPEFDKGHHQVTLRAIWPGQDVFENLKEHIRLFKEEGFLNIFFEVDLGISSQADLIASLQAVGFKPRILIPYGGRSDLVIFQLSI